MGHFLEVAHKVLFVVQEPLSARAITNIALKEGVLKTKGKTPPQTMKSKLSTDILRKKERSSFMRTSEGKFGLRSWTDYKEHIADRHKKSLLDEDAVVFPATSLSKYIPGSGLYTMPIENGRDLISECNPMLRRAAEKDYRVIQLVSVFIIKLGYEYLTYKRTKRLPESRLHGWYSVLFGGHLNPDDIMPLFDIFKPENAHFSFFRELEEEIRLPEVPTFVYKGLIYDDRREVSRQHLGVVYDVYLKSPDYKIGERGFLMDPKFETLPEIEARIDEFENWSVLIVDFERKSLEKEIE